MDSFESFITELLIKALHKTSPQMSPDDDAKVTKSVQDFVTTTMDLTAVYFALRAAKKPAGK
jgi:hypothetical protein